MSDWHLDLVSRDHHRRGCHFEPVSLEEYRRQVDRLVEQLAAQTRTPLHYFPTRNPHPEGSIAARWWELRRNVRVLGWTLYYTPAVQRARRILRWVWTPEPTPA
jgi:hypothetical protein